MLRMLGQRVWFILTDCISNFLSDHFGFRVWQCYRKIHRKVSDGKQND